ncbi:MAG TPA: DUF72 domain-containing protein [Candidatus Acidoferrum sp.]
MGEVSCGVSGWAYAKWKPDFYPAKLASAKFLGYYSSRLNSVEVNYTFRSFPSEKLLDNWIAATPPDFKFAIKAHQSITHIRRLKNVDETTAKFIVSLKPLQAANKLGPVLFQLPPNLKLDLKLLQDFLAELPNNTRCTIEFRHPSWFVEDVFSALTKRNVALCLAESDDLVAPDKRTADFCYLRLRKEGYSTHDRKAIERRVRSLAQHGEVFAYYMHFDSPECPLQAEDLLAAVKST